MRFYSKGCSLVKRLPVGLARNKFFSEYSIENGIERSAVIF